MSWFQRQRGKRGTTDEAASTTSSSDAQGDVVAEGVAGSGSDVEDGDGESGAAGQDDKQDATPGDARVGRGDAAELEERRRADGPHDESEVDGEASRVDLGAIRLPARQGMELRLEVEDKTKRVIAVTVTVAGSSVQMQAFAAPRRDGLWDEIRGDIATQITKQGGTADDVPGVFGREVLARLPVRTPDGRSGHRASRFVGVDGPRWFLRGVFTGPAAVDEDAATALEDVFRGTVVVRGSEAMAPRDLLALKLPAGTQTPGASPQAPGASPQAPGDQSSGDDSAGGARDPLKPFERGPEITERR